MDFTAASQRDEEVDDDAESAAAADQEPSQHPQREEEDAGDEVIENTTAIHGGQPVEQLTRHTSEIPAEHAQAAGPYLPAQQADQLQKAMEHAKSFFLPRKE